jgi:hypothetical protein
MPMAFLWSLTILRLVDYNIFCLMKRAILEIKEDVTCNTIISLLRNLSRLEEKNGTLNVPGYTSTSIYSKS